MERAIEVRRLLSNLHDLAPTPARWAEALPLLRNSAKQLGFSPNTTLGAIRTVARLWLHAQGGYRVGEDSVGLMSRVRALLQAISLRERQQLYSIALASEEIADQLGLSYTEVDTQIRQVLDGDDDFMCDVQRTHFTYISSD